ncbi:hypothetical protein ES703_77566 [subsurface metagenome]
MGVGREVERKGERISDLAPKGALPPARWRYQHFIEGVATEQIAEKAGADPTRVARVFARSGGEGEKDQVHIVGSPDVVKEIADGLESPKRELHTWYVGDAVTVEEERETVSPALEELVRSIPPAIISSPRDFLDAAFKLPLVAGPGAEVVERDLSDALEGFEPGKQPKKEGGE